MVRTTQTPYFAYHRIITATYVHFTGIKARDKPSLPPLSPPGFSHAVRDMQSHGLNPYESIILLIILAGVTP